MSHSSTGQQGRQDKQDPRAVLHDMVSGLVKNRQLTTQDSPIISEAFSTTQGILLAASSMSEQQLRQKGQHRTVRQADSAWLDDPSRQYASGILNLLDAQRDQDGAEHDTKFLQACQQGIGTIYPVYGKVGQNTPAQVATFVQQSGSQPGSGRPGGNF